MAEKTRGYDPKCAERNKASRKARHARHTANGKKAKRNNPTQSFTRNVEKEEEHRKSLMDVKNMRQYVALPFYAIHRRLKKRLAMDTHVAPVATVADAIRSSKKAPKSHHLEDNPEGVEKQTKRQLKAELGKFPTRKPKLAD